MNIGTVFFSRAEPGPGHRAGEPRLAAGAQAAPAHPWLSSPLRTPQPETCFSNLKDGAQIETPFVLKFGLSRYGLAPITNAVPRVGHFRLELVSNAQGELMSPSAPIDVKVVRTSEP